MHVSNCVHEVVRYSSHVCRPGFGSHERTPLLCTLPLPTAGSCVAHYLAEVATNETEPTCFSYVISSTRLTWCVLSCEGVLDTRGLPAPRVEAAGTRDVCSRGRKGGACGRNRALAWLAGVARLTGVCSTGVCSELVTSCPSASCSSPFATPYLLCQRR